MNRLLIGFIVGCGLYAQPASVRITPTVLPQVVDSEINDVKITLGHPGTFFISNGAKQKIVGISYQVRHTLMSEARQTGPHYVIDGMDTAFPGIGAGSSMEFEYGTKTKSIAIDWALLEDGTFYGSEKSAEALNLKSRVRREFFAGLQASENPGQYIVDLENCWANRECAKAAHPPLDWNEINRAVRYFHSNSTFRGNDQFKKDIPRISARHDRYPLAKPRKVAAFKPLSQEDGWEFLSFTGTCNTLSDPTQTGFIGGNALSTWNTSVASVIGICKYDFQWDPNATGTPANTLVPGLPIYGWVPRAVSYARGTFDAHVDARCYNADTQEDFNLPRQGAEFGLPKSADIALQVYGVGDPKYYPRYAAQTFIGNNVTPKWNAGTMYFSVAFGYPEAWGPTANDDGGQTFTSVVFFPPWGDYSDVSGGAVSGLGDGRRNPIQEGVPNTPFVSVNLNTEKTYDAAWTNKGFGFFLENFETNTECADPDSPNISAAVDTELNLQPDMDGKYVGTYNTTRIIGNAGKMVTLTGHKPAQQTAGNGDDGSCNNINPFEDCCCCYKAGVGIEFCQYLCLTNGGQAGCNLTGAAVTEGGFTPFDSTAFYTTGASEGYIYFSGGQVFNSGNGVSVDPHLHCNAGFTPRGGQCVSNCANPNVSPDAYGNCTTPPNNCLWTGLGIYKCGSGPIYGGCTGWDALGNCTDIAIGTDAQASSVCGYNYQTGFYEDLMNCPGANPPGCSYQGSCTFYGTQQYCSSSLVCPQPSCASGDYAAGGQCYCGNGQPDYGGNGCGSSGGSCSDGSYPDSWGNCGPSGQDCSGSCYWCGPNQTCCPSDDCDQAVYGGKVQILHVGPKGAAQSGKPAPAKLTPWKN